MQQMWISLLIGGFLIDESIRDLISKKISMVEGILLFIGGITYNITFHIPLDYWIYGAVFSVLVCGFSCISKEQLGLGDGIILLFLSPLLGKGVIGVFLLALFFCAITGIILCICKGITRKRRLPLVPFMMVAFLWGNIV